MNRQVVSFALTILLVLASGCARTGLIVRESTSKDSLATVVGDVRTVVRGQADETRMWSVPKLTFEAALGTAAVSYDANRQGTAIVLNGIAYIHPVNGQAGIEKSNGSMYSSFLVGIPPDASPTARYSVKGSEKGITLSDIYEDLSRDQSDPLFIVGKGKFAFTEHVALNQAPNKGEPTTGEGAEVYYGESSHEFNSTGVFTAIVLPDVTELRGSNMRVFSSELYSAGQGHVSRTHFAQMDDISKVDVAELSTMEGEVASVARLLSLSRLQNGEIAVYEIEDFDKR